MLSAGTTAGEAGSEVVALLEGGVGGANASQLYALYATVREPWLTRGLLSYHARTASARALDLLARAPDNHAKYLLEALTERLRAGERAVVLRALAQLIARRPPWLHRLTAHTLLRDVVRTLRPETDAVPLLNALLAVAALLPAAPAPLAPLLPDLTGAFARLAASANAAPPSFRDHLLLGLRALFHGLYTTHPCTLLDFLRQEYGPEPDGDAFRLTVLPMVESVRLHPALITGSRQLEMSGGRPAHVVALDPDLPLDTRRHSLNPLVVTVRPTFPAPTTPVPGSGAHASLSCATLRPGGDAWFPLSERCGSDSTPHTPLPATELASGAPGGSPPEAAIEATPENTPVKEPRAQFSFPAETTCVRTLSRHSQPPSPLGPVTADAYGGRLARVVLDRAQLDAVPSARRSRASAPDSPVPMGGAPPPAEWPIARPEPRTVPVLHPSTPESLNVEDREVLELTAWGAARDRTEWSERAPPGSTPRLRLYSSGTPGSGWAAVAFSRSNSCPTLRDRAPAMHSVWTQTVDAWPEPYEALLDDLFERPTNARMSTAPSHSDSTETGARRCVWVRSSSTVSGPCERLDSYLARLYGGNGGSTGLAHHELAEQLALTHAQLMYERWRREAHGERNRRLLGRCRQARATDLQNAALHDRLRALQHDRDELVARLNAVRALRQPEPSPDTERAAHLESQLAAERAARARAEAALREAETRRAEDASETQRLRADAFELRRRLEGAARAAAAGERRADHVKRLRRELLILGEREARLAEVAASGMRGSAAAATSRLTRVYRDEATAARAEAGEAQVRAEAAQAREADLEAALAARDTAVAELKRQARDAAEEHATRLAAVQDKYRALMHVLRRMETRRLELLAGGSVAGGSASGGAGGASPQSSPLSLSLTSAEGPLASRPALAEVSRVRHLLDDEPSDVR